MGLIQRLRNRLLADSFVVRRSVWKTGEAPTDLVKTQLAESYESSGSDDDRWRGTMQQSWVSTYTAVLTEDGQVHVLRELPRWVRVVVVMSLLASVLLATTSFWVLTTPPLISLVALLPPVFFMIGFTLRKGHDPPIGACTSFISTTTHRLMPASMVIVFLAGFFILSQILTPELSLKSLLILGFVPVLALILYRYIEHSVFSIVIIATATFFLNYAIFTVLALYVGMLASLVQNRRAATWQQALDFGAPVVPSLCVIIALFSIWNLRMSFDKYRRILNEDLQTFTSKREWWLAASLLGVNLVLAGGAVVGLSVIAYGLTDTLYPPVYILGEWVQQFLTGVTGPGIPQEVSTPEVMNGLYKHFEYYLRWLPGLSARAWSTVVVGLLLWPALFLVLGTIREVVARPYRAVAALRRSTRLTAAEGQNLLADDIQIRQIDLDGVPNAKPMTLLGEWRRYVFVSKVLVKELDDDEFEAILRHEEFHLQESNRSLLVECLSPLFGGKNALLAFYDYRASEQAADDYAAECVGAEQTRSAIKEMYRLDAVAEDSDRHIGTRHPGIIQRDEVVSLVDDIQGARHLRAMVRRPIIYLRATYNLHFGAVLLETAHLDPDERLERLRDE